jgi:glucan phosphoethanolaminetransferase (alkaline phosphatase superfamily)
MQLGAAAILAAVLAGIAERLLLPESALLSLGSRNRYLWVPVILAGVILVWLLAAAIAGLLLELVARPLARFTRRSRLVLGAGVALFASPYGVILASFTFSGPAARGLPLHPLLVGICASFVALWFATWAVLLMWKPARRSLALISAGSVLGFAFALIFINKLVLPNEYLPIHRFVSIAVVMLLLAGCDKLIAAVWFPGSSRMDAVLLWITAIVQAALAVYFGSTSSTLGWAAWGESAVARYVPARVDRSSVELPAGKYVLKPKVDGEKSAESRAQRRRASPPNIVLFIIDNVQADHVGAYGYRRKPTTPNIDELAGRGVLFRRAYSNYPQTRNFSSQLITGRGFPNFDAHEPPASFVRYSLTRILRARGYASFVHSFFEGGASSSFNPTHYGIDTFYSPPGGDEIRQGGQWPPIPVEEILSRLRGHFDKPEIKGKPNLIWVHLLQPHWLFNENGFGGSPKFDFGPGLLDQYDSAIAASDDWLPEFERLLRSKLTDPDNTIWIFASDHGAGVTRQKRHIGKTLYDDHVQVPLIMAGPGIEKGRLEFAVNLPFDLSATILDLAGLEAPPAWLGVSLLPWMRRESKPVPRPIILEYGNSFHGVLFGNWKYINAGGASALYDLKKDKSERKNLADRESDLVTELNQVAVTALGERLRAYENK